MNKGCTCALVALIDNASTTGHASSLVPPLAAQHNFVKSILCGSRQLILRWKDYAKYKLVGREFH